MADESIGTARIDVIVGTEGFDVAIERAKSRLSSMSADAQKAYAGMNAAEKRRIDSLIKQADTIGFTRQQQILYNAALKGTPVAILDELKAKMGAVSTSTAQAATAATKAFSGTNKSARELQFAMRGLPAQFTDIFTSLASGQRPMMVLLQQGGQVKDMFGGVVPALRAVGSGILAMINPFTLAAAAIAALGFAWRGAIDDASAFNKALLVTGGYAGKTSTQLEAMVASIAHTADATQGSAREALQKVAETGRFTGAQFDLVAVAAARMESATGQSIDTTIKKFEDLAKSPVDALLKLNETEHFLTEAQLDRVRALAAEGKEQEAAAEAARIYAARLDDVATAAEAARPHLANMWKEAKEGASSAWEEAKNFAEFMAAAAERANKIPWYQKLGPIGGLRAAVSGLYGAEPVAPVSVMPVAGAIDSNQAKAAAKLQEEAAKLKDRYLTREEQKTRALAELDKLRAQYSEQEYQNLKKQIDLKFADKGSTKSARTKETPSFRVDDMRQIEAEIAAQGKLDDQMQRGTAAVAAYKASLDDMLQTRQATIDLQIASVGMGQREIDQMQALISIDADYNKKKADLQKRQQSTSSALEKQWFAQQLADLEAYHDARVRIEVDGAKRAEEARADGMNGFRSAIADFMDEQKDMAGQMRSLTTDVIGGFGDAFAKFASGAESAKDAFGSLIDSMYQQALKAAANKALMSILGAFGFGGMSLGQSDSLSSGAGDFVDSIFNAKGGVYDSPSLSAYSGGVYNSPQLFKFAHGAGVFGEAGPEAIMPLRRMPSGKLGVETSSNRDESSPRNQRGSTTINVNVQPTSTRRTADQVAQEVARKQRMVSARNG